MWSFFSSGQFQFCNFLFMYECQQSIHVWVFLSTSMCSNWIRASKIRVLLMSERKCCNNAQSIFLQESCQLQYIMNEPFPDIILYIIYTVVRYHKIGIVSTRTKLTPMNIGTHFDYNNHIVFISTHTKISIHMKTHRKWKWICWFGFFKRSEYLSPVSTSDCKQAIDTR